MRDWVLRLLPEMKDMPPGRRRTLNLAARIWLVRQPRYWLSTLWPVALYSLPALALVVAIKLDWHKTAAMDPGVLIIVLVVFLMLWALGMLPLTALLIWLDLREHRRAIRELLRDRHGRWRVCACGYNLRRTVGTQCPECGTRVVR